MVEFDGYDVREVLKRTKTTPPPTTSVTFAENVVENLKDGDGIKVTNQNNQKYLVFGGILLAVVGVTVYIYVQRDKKKEEQLRKQDELLSKKDSLIHELDVSNKMLSNYVNEYESYFKDAEKRNAFKPVKSMNVRIQRKRHY